MSTHTPGPWQITRDKKYDQQRISSGDLPVAVTRAEANARLIAVAPDLLDLAKDIAGLDHCYLAQGDKALQQALREWKAAARAAIAKAEGVS